MEKKEQHSPLWYYLLGGAVGAYVVKAHNVHFDNHETKDLKPPFVGIGNHQGFYDWAYAAKALYPHKIRFVASRYHILNPTLGKIMQKMDPIPKSQFTSDIAAVKNIIKAIKHGENVFMYPSGKLSLFGEDEKPFGGTYELLKKLGVPVVMVQLDGSYRTAPRYNSATKKGRVDVKTSILFTPEELENLSLEEGKAKLTAAFCHDDFNSPNKAVFKSKDIISGLEDMLYMCPKCKAEYSMMTYENCIRCTSCGFSASMDNRFMLKGVNGGDSPSTISEWSRLMKAFEVERLRAEPDYSLNEKMKLFEHIEGKKEHLTQTGEVDARLDCKGFYLNGTRNGKAFEAFFSYKDYPSIHILEKTYLLIPDNETVLCVSPSKAAIATKWAVMSEIFAANSKE